MEIVEQSVHSGSYTLFRYHIPDDANNSKQTLFVAYNNESSDSNSNKNGWFVVCGEWEVRSIIELSQDLKRGIIDKNSSAKSKSVSNHCVRLRAITDGGRLQIDFFDQYPAAVSSGSKNRWRIYPGKLQSLIDLLTCFEAISDEVERVVRYLPLGCQWLIPDDPSIQFDQIIKISDYKELQAAVASHESGEDEACELFAKVSKSHLAKIDQKVETVTCTSCSQLFVRPRGQVWRKACLSCYLTQKSSAGQLTHSKDSAG